LRFALTIAKPEAHVMYKYTLQVVESTDCCMLPYISKEKHAPSTHSTILFGT